MLGIPDVCQHSNMPTKSYGDRGLTSFVSQTSAPSVYMTRSFWLPFPGAKRIFFTQPRCVGIPLKELKIMVTV